MIYLTTNPADPAAPLWILHLPTLTLGQYQPGPHHRITIQDDTPSPEDALRDFSAWLEARSPGSHLTLITSPNAPTPIPESIILTSADPATHSILIHYPALGFAAGLNQDGSKIPPVWKDPQRLTPAQRSHILAQAADTLVNFINNLPPPSQAT